MITFDLKCNAGHVFEGWFRSSADFDQQAGDALIPCPTCGDSRVIKAVMAPHVGRKGNQLAAPLPVAPLPISAESQAPAAPVMAGTALPAPLAAMAAALAAAQAEVLPQSSWVGDRFAARARAMHDGSEAHSLIHGQATHAEAEALVEDGVPILPLLVPIIPPELQN